VISGFAALRDLPWERVTDKIERRVLAGQQGMIVWWKMKAGAHAAVHQHRHEQIVWMIAGKMDFRIGSDSRSMTAGDVAVIPSNVFREDTEVVDIFSPPREDFLAGVCRSICARRSRLERHHERSAAHNTDQTRIISRADYGLYRDEKSSLSGNDNRFLAATRVV